MKKKAFVLLALIIFSLTGCEYLEKNILNSVENEGTAIYENQNKFTYEYDNKNSVVTINNNIPSFNDNELSLSGHYWQEFSDLDSLNRVGVANALLHKDAMPKEERGDISHIYPTGWKQRKLTDGTWLYNRSHLIGFQLTGENANWKNLFTGTEQLNKNDMLNFENQIAEYLRNTSNHVRYRVTPHFKENELLCRVIQMEAQSIEDNEISFNVLIYNVENGFQLNYDDGKIIK